MKKIPVILDCDPGHDDAIAIMVALASEKIDVKAIITVGGNQTVKKTTRNALNVINYIDKSDVPVISGADKPICKALRIAQEVHGESGLDGPVIPVSEKKPLDVNAYEYMAKIINDNEDEIVLVPTGPLTNIAILLLSYPQVKNKIKCISLMGGSAIGGNWTSAAEFNIWVDPEAAKIVFDSGIPIIMSGLDVTHKARVYDKDIELIRSQGGKVALFIADLLDYFKKFHREICGWDFAPLHDPCAVAYLINNDIFGYKPAKVMIDIDGKYTVGCTVTEFQESLSESTNTKVLTEVDCKKFIDLLIDTANYYDRR